MRTLIERLRSQPGQQPGSAELSTRELDVLRLLAEGLSTAEVAGSLNYSERAIRNVLHDMITRLRLRNRTHAVAYAIRNGAVTPTADTLRRRLACLRRRQMYPFVQSECPRVQVYVVQGTPDRQTVARRRILRAWQPLFPRSVTVRTISPSPPKCG
ncbi:response regulator transcription factor [Streptomyces sp. NPDC006602]|uniref:response regulator transcription factor n=1 Tax=Streptomyces sp. NPDC006602 TaxID=3364751 RepID=UPI0036AA8299